MRFGEGNTGDDGGEGVDEECLRALCSAVLQSSINNESLEDGRATTTIKQQTLTTSDVSSSSTNSLTTSDVFSEAEIAPVSTSVYDDNDNEINLTQSEGLPISTSSLDNEILIDADGNPASVHLDRLSSLLTFITNSIPVSAVVWDLCAAVAAQRKETREVLECRLRQCRALQRPVGWEKDESTILYLAKAASYATDCYLNFQEKPLAIALLEAIIARIDAGDGICSKGEGRKKIGTILKDLLLLQ
jgi:hypothetical protein